MDRRNRALDLIGTRPPHAKHLLDEPNALLNLPAFPLGPILILEEYQIAIFADTRLASRVVEQHECQQAHGLGLVWKERGQTARKAKGIGNEVSPDELSVRGRQVTFVEQEVQDAENGVETWWERRAIRDLVRDAGARDLLLCPSHALSDRCFGDQECTRDFRDGETPKRAQSKCDLRLGRERGVATGEDQAELIVGNRRVLNIVLRTLSPLIQTECKRQLATPGFDDPEVPKPVNRFASSGRRKPRAWGCRHAVLWPPLKSGHERVLKRILGEVEVAQESNQRCQDCAGLRLENPLENVRDLAHLHLRDVHERPDLDRTTPSIWALRSTSDRLIQVFDVDDVYAAELLLRIRERAVGGDRLSVPHAYRRGGGRWVERFARKHLAGVLELDAIVHVLSVDAALLFLGLLGPILLGGVDQKRVFHVSTPFIGSTIEHTVE